MKKFELTQKNQDDRVCIFGYFNVDSLENGYSHPWGFSTYQHGAIQKHPKFATNPFSCFFEELQEQFEEFRKLVAEIPLMTILEAVNNGENVEFDNGVILTLY